ncbi:hypothetical protein T439DRAFT_347874 [Meredithblackwellia eburnea MCA 4105]
MAVPLWTPNTSNGSKSSKESLEIERQTAFLQFKSICVPLLAASRQQPPSTSVTIPLLTRLVTALGALPLRTLTPALCNYIFFPLTSLLQPQSQHRISHLITEKAYLVLAELIQRWRCVDMEKRIREELWIMLALRLGGPLDPKGKGKGRAGDTEGEDIGEEVQREIVKALARLMAPLNQVMVPEETQAEEEQEDEEDFLGTKIDWSASDSSDPVDYLPPPRPPASLPAVLIPPSPPPLPILFHTLTTLLNIASSSTSLPSLQIEALESVEIILRHYLSVSSTSATDTKPGMGPAPLLATSLPSTCSSLARIALSLPRSSQPTPTPPTTKPQPTSVIVKSLSLLAFLIVSAVGDEISDGLRKGLDGAHGNGNGYANEKKGTEKEEATLEEIITKNYNLDFSSHEVPEVEAPSRQPSPSPAATQHPTGPTHPTPSWYLHTLQSLLTLLHSLFPLTSHPSPLVRGAFVDLLLSLQTDTPISFLTPFTQAEPKPEILSHPLHPLLLLSTDEWEDSVAKPAREGLVSSKNDPSLIREIVQRRISLLPLSLSRGDEKSARECSRVIRAGLGLIVAGGGGGEGWEKAFWRLVGVVKFERIPIGTGRSAGGGGAGAKGWIEDLVDGDDEWPDLRMRNFGDRSTKRELRALWNAIGVWAGKGGGEEMVVELFLGGRREAGMWSVLDGILAGWVGLGEEGKDGKRRRKVLRNVVKCVLEMLEDLEGADEDDDGRPTGLAATTAVLEASDTDLLVSNGTENRWDNIEQRSLLSHTPSLDVLQPTSNITSQEITNSNRLLLTILSLRLLSTISTVLGSGFQPHLLKSLYFILSSLSPAAHPLLRTHAEITLARVSHSTAYASPRNLVLANADYVLNSVSQRLTVTRLDPSAPGVLVEMIRVVGADVVPLVGDLVEDVCEALDDYHGYAELTAGLWEVLDVLIGVMSAEVAPTLPSAEGKDAGKKKDEWEEFENWFKERSKPILAEDLEDFGPNPQRPFASTVPNPSQDDGPSQFPSATEEAAPPPPTRAQQVAAQIIAKAVYFLSHENPILRARVLALIATSVPLFVSPEPTSSDDSNPPPTRESDLLPVIHRSWPYILNRFSDPHPFVVLEACKLIEALSRHVGEWMSRRILDDVWPKLKGLVEMTSFGSSEKGKGRDGSLARREAGDRGMGAYSTSHRLALSILSTILQVALTVPLKEDVLWDQAVTFRHFLDRRMDPELQDAARRLYVALGKVNEDVVWLVLTASVGLEGLPEWLQLDGDVQEGVDWVLKQF